MTCRNLLSVVRWNSRATWQIKRVAGSILNGRNLIEDCGLQTFVRLSRLSLPGLGRRDQSISRGNGPNAQSNRCAQLLAQCPQLLGCNNVERTVNHRAASLFTAVNDHTMAAIKPRAAGVNE